MSFCFIFVIFQQNPSLIISKRFDYYNNRHGKIEFLYDLKLTSMMSFGMILLLK